MKCFPSEAAYLLWRRSGTSSVLPCQDCNPAHKARMLQAGRCEQPAVVFVKNKDGELVGRVPTVGGAGPTVGGAGPAAEESVFLVRVATRLLGDAALAELIGISAPSLPQYRNGNRTLPGAKVRVLRAAVRRGAGLLVG